VVPTKYGKVRGYIDDGIYAFRGIPYAKAERFMPPQAPDKWDDVRQCQIYGPQAMQGKAQSWGGQSDPHFGFQFVVEPMDEDCFVLNVWSQGINDGKKRPVWVWIHGGGFSSGSANQLPFFDGRALADKGDIVVVTVNHRLNTLGYVDLRGLGGKYSESVNLGMQDLVAALKWVNENIENFGGDPNTVTIDGQSGGGAKVSTLTAMPSAAGLFQRAIVQSGAILEVGGNDLNKEFGLEFINELGITPDEADKLNDFSYEDLVEASNRVSSRMRDIEVPFMMHPGQCPVIDGKYIVQHPFDPTPAEFSRDVAMLIGSNLNESGYINRQLITPKTMTEVKATLTERYGAENADKYIAAYQEAYPDDDQPQHILTTSIRTRALQQAAIKNAQGGAPAYVYLFEWQSPPNDGSLGAAHGMELPFMFNNIALARPLTGGGKDAYEMADKISSAWINFVKTGDPNCKELPKWPAYTPDEGATMIFDNKCEVRYNFDQKLIDLVSTLPSISMF
ncbi:MAG TPA: carboxylesterase family protein, partial [Draconibacterium sp.]|nr:carboxylesterase family protein [Draconibacterium sp.]